MRNEAVIDFVIELYTFYNFYLDSEGFYQIRTSLHVHSGHYSQVFLGASKQRDGIYVSKCFPISMMCDTLQTDISEIVRFEVHAFPRGDVKVSLQNSYYELKISLYATSMDNIPPTTHTASAMFELVSERVVTLSFDPTSGLHHYLPVVFEVGDLSVLTVAIHASLVMVCLPDIEKLNQSYLKRIVGQLCAYDYQSACCYGASPDRNVPQELISLLTRTANQLRRRLEDFREAVYGNAKHKKEDTSDTSSKRARERVGRFATCNRGETVQFIDEEARKMCVVLIVLWEQYLEIALGRVEVRRALYLPLQKKRLARMAEAYLILYRDRKSIYYDAQTSPTSSEECYKRIAQQMRKSEYLRTLPVLEVECPDVDGCAKNIPIIFEERYTEPRKKPKEEPSSTQSQRYEGSNQYMHEHSLSISSGSMEFLALTTHPDIEVCNCRLHDRFVSLFPPPRTAKTSCPRGSSSRSYTEYSSPLTLQQERRFSKVKRDFLRTIRLPVTWETPDLEELCRWNFSGSLSPKNAASDNVHLIVMVHGLFGCATDLRLFRVYLELANPYSNVRFLLSRSNEREGTFKDFDTLGKRLAIEIIEHIRKYSKKPSRISFIGFSMGNLIIRSALAKSELKPFLRNLHTFLSLGGPHLGVAYNPSRIIAIGLWYLQRYENTDSLRQMALKDKEDLRDTYLYRLSKDTGLRRFKNILLVGSACDHIAPLHSAQVKLTRAALSDNSPQGIAYREMSWNILKPLVNKRGLNLIRYEIHLPFKASILTTNVHIAPLDRDVLVQKLVMVSCAKHFI